MQILAQWRIDLAVVAEPYAVPDRHGWHGDTRGSVAVVGPAAAGSPPIVPLKKGAGYVAVNWRGTKVIRIYYSPNGPMQNLEALLEEVTILVQEGSPGPAVVLDDLNARSRE